MHALLPVDLTGDGERGDVVEGGEHLEHKVIKQAHQQQGQADEKEKPLVFILPSEEYT